MTYTITVEDDQFGVATGSNVNARDDASLFDGPPSDSTNLVITANENDPSPSVFSVGDTYDLSYGDGSPGVGGVFDDAVVLRSDALPEGGHAVVFEGVDENGEVHHIVWAPGVDLQAWYDAAASQGQQPGFYTSDQDSATRYEQQFVCFGPQTRLRTPRGEVPVDQLKTGDLVCTRDHGPQPILWVGRRKGPVDHKKPGQQPVLIEPRAFAPGALRHKVILSPQHRLLLVAPNGEEWLAPAKAFVGLRGIRHMSGRREMDYITFLLGRHEILDASGLAAESFLPGPQGYRLLSAQEIKEVEAVMDARSGMGSMLPARPCLGGSTGRRALKQGARLALFDAQPQCATAAAR